MKNSKISLVNTLAAQIRKSNGTNRSESMTQAWALINFTPDAQVLRFEKIAKPGVIEVRIVSPTWSMFYTPVGGTSTNKPGQLLFADLAKVALKIKNPIISTYQTQIAA